MVQVHAYLVTGARSSTNLHELPPFVIHSSIYPSMSIVATFKILLYINDLISNVYVI